MRKTQSYKNLEIYQLAMKLAIEIHKMSLKDLPIEMLYKTKSLSKPCFDDFYSRYKELGAKLFKFRQTVIQKHNIFDNGSL